MFRIIFGIFIFPKDTFKSILNEQAYVFKEVTSLFEKARQPYFTQEFYTIGEGWKIDQLD